MWLYTFVFDHHITLLVCGVLVGACSSLVIQWIDKVGSEYRERESLDVTLNNWFVSCQC
jgi:hypothetical protein